PMARTQISTLSLHDALPICNGKLDMASSIEVVRKTVQTFASPKAASLMVNGNFEVGGIAPLGAAYAFVNDRAISNLEAASGKRRSEEHTSELQSRENLVCRL